MIPKRPIAEFAFRPSYAQQCHSATKWQVMLEKKFDLKRFMKMEWKCGECIKITILHL